MRLRGTTILCLLTACLTTGAAVAEDGDQPGGIKQMQGISIKADKEAPRSLVIVPWHDAEHKQNTSLSSSLVDDSLQAIDQRALEQQLRLHELGATGWHRLTPDTR
jgi:hypothetical protein